MRTRGKLSTGSLVPAADGVKIYLMTVDHKNVLVPGNGKVGVSFAIRRQRFARLSRRTGGLRMPNWICVISFNLGDFD